MYLQITSRCNLSCRHCGLACLEYGEDMTMETFKNAVRFYKNVLMTENSLCIGGGEPTLHPLLYDFIILCANENIPVSVVTNGTIENKTLNLFFLRKINMLNYIGVSDTNYHKNQVNKISDKVRILFSSNPTYTERHNGYGIELYSKLTGIINEGRGSTIEDAHDICICDDLFVKPNGDTYHCGCSGSKFFYNISDKKLIGCDKIKSSLFRCKKEVKNRNKKIKGFHNIYYPTNHNKETGWYSNRTSFYKKSLEGKPFIHRRIKEIKVKNTIKSGKEVIMLEEYTKFKSVWYPHTNYTPAVYGLE